MASPLTHHRVFSSTPSTTSTTSTSINRNNRPTSPPSASSAKTIASNKAAPKPTLLQPRVAVILNVPPPWHPWLFALRLCSCLPAAWFGLPGALRLLLRALPSPPHEKIDRFDALTELGLATIWVRGHAIKHGTFVHGRRKTDAAEQCFASGYLSFFFTDCLMSRWYVTSSFAEREFVSSGILALRGTRCATDDLWGPGRADHRGCTASNGHGRLNKASLTQTRLINYSPQATIVRLLSINAVNAYVTSTVLALVGGFSDLRLLLPGWIGIATVCSLAVVELS